jgi:hypothetical protein
MLILRDVFDGFTRFDDFRPALLAPYAWGDHHLTDHGRNLVLVGPATGAEIDPVLIDRATGRPWTEAGTVFIAGADIRRRYAAPQPS